MSGTASDAVLVFCFVNNNNNKKFSVNVALSKICQK